MATFADIATSAAINLLSSFLFLLAFSLLRLQPQNARVFYPKWYIKGVRKASKEVAGINKRLSISHYVNLDYKAYIKMLSWMWDAILMPEEELIEHAGLDSAVFLRIFLLGMKIFVPMAGVGFLILLPVNGTDNNLAARLEKNPNDVHFSQVDKLSISNVTNKSPRLWAHLICTYIFTFWTCKMLYLEYKAVADMRLHHLATKKRSPDQFTVLVRQVPPDPDMKKSVFTCVDEFFKSNHRDYLITQVVYDANRLGRTLNKIGHLENWLSYYQNKYERHPNKRPIKKMGFLGLYGEQVDAINYYKAEIETLRVEAGKEQDEVLSDPKSIMPAAFVSFKSRWGAAVAAQTHQTRNPTKWITDWAPEPRDVYWPSLSIPFKSLTMRYILMGGAFFLLIFFFMIPVVAVQSLANLDGIVKKFSIIKPLVDQPSVKSLLQGFIPGLALRIFLAILPTILMLMARFEGHLSLSTLDRRAATKLYYFMVVNVFFGSIISGSLLAQLTMMFTNSSLTNILKSLGDTIPTKATFFITYIMVDGWAGVSMEILPVYNLVLYHLKNMFLVKTEKDRDEAMAPGNLLLDQNIPRLEFYFLLGIVYSVTTPIIIPFIIVFFAFGYLAYRNQVINVYDPDYDSGAAFWPHVHGRIIVAMIIEQLTLIGLFTTKGPVGFLKEDNAKGSEHAFLGFMRYILSTTPFMVALPIGTLVFHYYCRKRFDAAFQNYPLAEANDKDLEEKKDFPDLDLEKYLDKTYLHPVLKEEEEIQGRFRTIKTLRRRNKDVEEPEDDEDGNSGRGRALVEESSPYHRGHGLAEESPRSRSEVMEAVPDTPPYKSEISKSSELLLQPTYRHPNLKSDRASNVYYDSIPSSSHKSQNSREGF